MSQISQIKGQINQVATNIESTAGALYTFGHQLDSHITVINSAIGGTAANEDKDMINALREGRKAVMDAAVQLREAATKAKDWVSKA